MAFMSWILNKMFSEKNTLRKKISKSKPQIYKQKQPENKPLTLVLDLDETLIHSTTIKPKYGNYSTISVRFS